MSHFQMPAREFMQSPVHSVSPEATLAEAHRKMQALKVSGLAVVAADERLVGVITRGDLLRVGRRQAGSRQDAHLLELPTEPVSTAMTAAVISAGPDDPLDTYARLMRKHHVHRVFCVHEDRLVGVVSTRDVMRAIRQKRVNAPVTEFMSSPALTVRANEPLSLATDRLAKAHISGLVVVDGGWPIGVFDEEQALAAKGLETATPVEEAMSPAILALASNTRLYRAAEQASALDVRRVVVLEGDNTVGILTGLDFVKAAL